MISFEEKLINFLKERGLQFCISHTKGKPTAYDTAVSLQMAPQRFLKAVLLVLADGNTVLAVVSADCMVKISAVGRVLGKKARLASELEVKRLFPDCKKGAIPPFCMGYDVPVVLNTSFKAYKDMGVYFKAGTHSKVVEMRMRGLFNTIKTFSSRVFFADIAAVRRPITPAQRLKRFFRKLVR